jgi:hypothetical protein
LILTSTLVLTAARRTQGWRWSATVVALIYLLYRAVGYALLGAFDFPVSFIPAMLLLGAFVIDLAESWRWHPIVAALAIVAVYYPSAVLIGDYTLMPPFALSTAPIVLIALWGGLATARWWDRRDGKVAMQAA